jgi:L-xylulokinase
MAAGIAAGVYKDYQEAISRTVTITKTIMPRPEYKEIYEKKYAAYRAVIDGLAGAWSHFEN